MSKQLFIPNFRVQECLEEIKECLEKGWTGLGFKTILMEEEWCKYTSLPNAHFLNSATSGLHLALNIFKSELNWSNEDEIITSPLTFISTNHSIYYENLKPVFADVDEYLCLDPREVEKKITPKTKAIIFVGLGGNSGNYEKIVDICKKKNLILILDAAHMAGTRINGIHVGKEADCTVFSFQAVKNLATADSGMICFKEKYRDDRARKLSWLGINKDTYSRSLSNGSYKWKYDVEEVGFKYHGNSIMAAIGLVQLRYLDRDNSYRRQLAKWYSSCLKDNANISIIPISPKCESSRHLFQVRVLERDRVLTELNNVQIFPGVHYIDNTQYKPYLYGKGTCPNAHKASNEILSLPMHMGLTFNDISEISQSLKDIVDKL